MSWRITNLHGTVLVAIGSCSGTQEASEHVEAVLGAIFAGCEGSKAYAIYVREFDVEQGRELLRRDPQKDQFHVRVYDD
jgi:hypothetical protein